MADAEVTEDGRQTGFPQSPSAFDADPRVSFSRLDDKFILETDEGNEYEWDGDLKRWVPVVGFSPTPIVVLQLRDCSPHFRAQGETANYENIQRH